MSFQIGDTVGDYEIIGVLGSGGMGKVYKVRNTISDRIEAMKVLLPNLAGTPELADRFLREIKVHASLEHPNIAALRTAQRIDNQLVMIMELVEGATLEGMLRQGPVPLRDGVGYICQALAALQYAHEQGVIHRDIKPANMMLTPDGIIKLMDFGIAKAAADRKLTMTGTTMGSLYYMSPEQVRGETGSVDARSDLYALGVSLYEVATGTRPFKGDSDYAIMSAHLEQVPQPPIELDPALPAALNEIILMAIAKDPAQRFQSAAAFRAALESVRASLGDAVAARTPAAAPAAKTNLVDVLWPDLPSAPPPFAAAQGPGPSLPPPPAARVGGHRGLYMLAGSLLTLAILLFAGLQIANWRRTKAGETPAVTTPQTPAQTTTPPAATEPPAGGPATPPPESPPAATAPSSPEPGPATEPPVTRQTRETPPARPSQAPKSIPVQPAEAVPSRPDEPQAVLPAAVRQAKKAPAAQPPPAGAEKAKALDEQRERMAFLGSRALAVKGSLDNMERDQRAAGLSMRGDIAAAKTRMAHFLDLADSALAAGDPDAAKRNMDLAERDVERLEKFLGR